MLGLTLRSGDKTSLQLVLFSLALFHTLSCLSKCRSLASVNHPRLPFLVAVWFLTKSDTKIKSAVSLILHLLCGLIDVHFYQCVLRTVSSSRSSSKLKTYFHSILSFPSTGDVAGYDSNWERNEINCLQAWTSQPLTVLQFNETICGYFFIQKIKYNRKIFSLSYVTSMALHRYLDRILSWQLSICLLPLLLFVTWKNVVTISFCRITADEDWQQNNVKNSFDDDMIFRRSVLSMKEIWNKAMSMHWMILLSNEIHPNELFVSQAAGDV